ncbi:hypothetical protein UVI_02005530 [Ustilaginoidea virens]|uniref:Uncharacterized protein n=1 Tax=Ustilaginoidea virens TaxID=1159556 RepID=A0A1B5KXK2_USTVR|nr:hypothetical protein UVI_02005530 [Ustilaginoidea virens]
MIVRAARSPIVCLACRLRLSQRNGSFPLPHTAASALAFAAYQQRSSRRHASDLSPRGAESTEDFTLAAVRHQDEPATRAEAAARWQPGHGEAEGKSAEEQRADSRPESTTAADSAHAPDPAADQDAYGMPENPAPTEERAGASRSEMKRRGGLPHDLVSRRSLGVNALGKPIEAIVVSAQKVKRPKKAIPALQEMQAPTDAPINWRTVYPPQGDESALSDKVWDNIEEIRPKDGRAVGEREFEKMMESLVNGFTQEQLVTYLNLDNRPGGAGWADDATPSYPWIRSQSPWSAAQRSHWHDLRNKQRQAFLILSAKWKLEVREHIQGLGAAVVWLQPKVFALVARRSSGILEQLRADYLDKSNNERISTSPQENRLGIYAPKATVSAVLTRLDEIARSIQTETVPVGMIEEDNLREEMLEELANLTNTALQLDQEHAQLSVSWLPVTDAPSKELETPPDVVLRLLVSKEMTPKYKQVQVLPETPSAKTTRSATVAHQRDKRSMAWRDKLRPWYRFTNPVGHATDAMTPALDFPRHVQLPRAHLASPEERVETVATFGHILHMEQGPRTAKSAAKRRTLCPVVPHPAALTHTTADAPAPSAQERSIILNFAADATAPSSSVGGAIPPPVRLRVPINALTDLSNFSFPRTSVLEAVLPWREIDILLPNESVDVRISQTRLLPLDAGQAPLQEFLRASEFNPLQGRLLTPSKTTFSIPGTWVSAEQCRPAPAGQPAGQPANLLVNLPYTFAGLEIHQAIDLDWKGHVLRYSSTEAGQHGGQQQRLSLASAAAAAPGSSNGGMTRDQLQSFLTLVEETATGVHFSWHEGHKLAQAVSSDRST